MIDALNLKRLGDALEEHKGHFPISTLIGLLKPAPKMAVIYILIW